MDTMKQLVAAYLEGLDAQAMVLKQKLEAGQGPTTKETIDFLSLSTIRLRELAVMLAGAIDELRGSHREPPC